MRITLIHPLTIREVDRGGGEGVLIEPCSLFLVRPLTKYIITTGICWQQFSGFNKETGTHPHAHAPFAKARGMPHVLYFEILPVVVGVAVSVREQQEQ